MAYTLDEVAQLMSMRPHTITEWHEVVDGLLVVTNEGAQTLIRPDGRIEAVLPRRDLLNAGGRGSVKRWEAEQAEAPGPDLTPVDIEDTAVDDELDTDGKPDEEHDPGTEEEEDVDEAVPDGTAEVVLAWAGEDRDRLERALAAEMKRESSRTTLMNKLSTALAKIGAQS